MVQTKQQCKIITTKNNLQYLKKTAKASVAEMLIQREEKPTEKTFIGTMSNRTKGPGENIPCLRQGSELSVCL